MNSPQRMVVDWSRVVEETRRVGYSLSEISQFTAIPRSNLLSYQFHVTEPRHFAGMTLLKFWAEVTGNNSGEPPLIPRPLSAASFR